MIPRKIGGLNRRKISDLSRRKIGGMDVRVIDGLGERFAKFAEIIFYPRLDGGFSGSLWWDDAVTSDESFEVELEVETENTARRATRHSVVENVMMQAEFVDDFPALTVTSQIAPRRYACPRQ